MTSNQKILALFPGQGSQRVGMGRELFESHPIAQELFAAADQALGYSLSKLCFEGPAETLTLTENTQPAILVVSTIAYRVAQETVGSALPIVAAAGHSLGEYSALVAAGALRFEDAVTLVHKRGRYMQQAVPAGQGKMIAVLGKEVADLETAAAKVTSGVAQIANVNAPGQVVVAGSVAGIAEFLEQLGAAKTIELPVSAPFHCSLMKPAEEQLAKDLADLKIADGNFPVYANYHARPLTKAEEIREALRLQVCGRVRWVECMERAIGETAPTIGIEFGEGNVLCGLLKRIKRELPTMKAGDLAAVGELATVLKN